MVTLAIVIMSLLLSYLITIYITKTVLNYHKNKLIQSTITKLSGSGAVTKQQEISIKILYQLLEGDVKSDISLKYVRVLSLAIIMIMLNPLLLITYILMDIMMYSIILTRTYQREVELPILT